MCGIFAIINYKNSYNFDYVKMHRHFMKGKGRGPEFSILKEYEDLFLGFHRLAINGLNQVSNQPIEIDNIALICNGEIYNFAKLARENGIELVTNSDCEIIIHLYKLYGIEYALNLLDGVFAFVLYDKSINNIIFARDPHGVRPLYYFNEKSIIGVASELQVLYSFPRNKNSIQNFMPGHYMIYNTDKVQYYCSKYTHFPCINKIYWPNINNQLYSSVVNYITSAVKKRVNGTTERPIACLLSGGLDSSLIAALVNEEFKKEETLTKKTLKTFSIGLEGSEDLKYAAIVAKHLESDHQEIIVTEDDFFNAIPDVIKTISSYDTTTVRASVGNYLIGKYIKENSNCKVIFNGDGADELMGGYLYFKKAPNAYEFDKECRRLLQDIFMFDVLRSDRCISTHGLEPRTPFLDKKWVEFYLSIDRNLRFNTTKHNCEKYLIRKSVDTLRTGLLPSEILWRTKEAFSDGVSSLQKSWFQIIQEKIKTLGLDEELDKTMNMYKNFGISNNIPENYEQAYYRYLFNKHYQGTDHLIDYYWMPKYVDAKDASARTLNIYNEKNSNQ